MQTKLTEVAAVMGGDSTTKKRIDWLQQCGDWAVAWLDILSTFCEHEHDAACAMIPDSLQPP
jgi:hypothetical protein